MRCDLVVVGAGPAGSMTAKAAAEAGLKVVMLEKRQEIGDPVRCAEGVSKAPLKKLVDPDPAWISAEVKGARIRAPDGTEIVISEDRAGAEVGYVLERKVFDRALAQKAAEAGAEVMVKTRALRLLWEGGVPAGVYAQFVGEKFKIEAPLVIGADGVESKVGRWAGIDTALKPEDIETCAQFLVQDEKVDEDYCEFCLGNQIAPGGYVWSFPKGRGIANVGIGVLGSKADPGMPMRLLREFVKERFPDGKVLEVVVGGVPVSGPIERTVADGIILVGDAARQSDPITGGGIINAMNAGMMAGEIAADLVPKGEMDSGSLQIYEKRWRETIGKHISRNFAVKEFFVDLTDDDLNHLIHSLDGIDVAEMNLRGLLKVLVRQNPKHLLKLRHLLG
ncbi:NAD(P)/FAD-dependent oxidoreductase [Candidatus Methanocrinis natronophilus]|uniref:Digeranylgeranylglycerophospholipid reductase n=1 Tax=Candidatus Methanocrinis natronophilus TaxID=3033396 RepID=A0ABT5X6U7_9EURY|nr:NAD(P)/FAD-dependent oxidoreductase [Candidatus Methanocrinis natronophilus]MDF0590423.1 NAD(P)/FAD-dependent oxidoreductase [Candidatus Methanocrinis natronophilus]